MHLAKSYSGSAYYYLVNANKLRHNLELLNIPIYLINLADRPDRLSHALDEAKKHGLSLIVINAVPKEKANVSYSSFLTPAAEACWLSHVKAMDLIASGDSCFAIILEDDFQINNFSRLSKSLLKLQSFDWEIVQLGFLRNGFRDGVDICLANLEALLFHLLSKLGPSRLHDRLRISRSIDAGWRFVPDDLRAGAHAYLITATTAKKITESFRNQKILTADGFLISTNWTRPFRTFRLSRSVIGQIASPSSIKGL